jgi:hypothetical protein
MGLGAYQGVNDDDRHQEIMNWFVPDARYAEDQLALEMGRQLLDLRIQGRRGPEIYEFPAVGRVIYLHALAAMMTQVGSPVNFPTWLKQTQSELSEWLRGAPRRKSEYFLRLANLESYERLPHARDDPRGQFHG